MALMKSLVLLTNFGVASALAPGDCAFVGIYGDQDDFALVLLEGADGENIFLTEDFPKDSHFEVSKFVAAKKHVKDAARGAVLKKADFETDSASLVAPTSLTVFSGSAAAPTALCKNNALLDDGQLTCLCHRTLALLLRLTWPSRPPCGRRLSVRRRDRPWPPPLHTQQQKWRTCRLLRCAVPTVFSSPLWSLKPLQLGSLIQLPF